MGATALAFTEKRETARDEVDYRARAYGGDAQPLSIQVVNMSAQGLMARCETPFDIGDRIRIVLPIAGPVVAEVRWALGGRIGCQFDQAIDLASYYELLSVLVKNG